MEYDKNSILTDLDIKFEKFDIDNEIKKIEKLIKEKKNIELKNKMLECDKIIDEWHEAKVCVHKLNQDLNILDLKIRFYKHYKKYD